jgi:hypothetical protein
MDKILTGIPRANSRHKGMKVSLSARISAANDRLASERAYGNQGSPLILNENK